MTKREAHKRALNDAAQMLESAADGGYSDELDDDSAAKANRAMRDLANGLGRRFSRLVLQDVRWARAAAWPGPQAKE